VEFLYSIITAGCTVVERNSWPIVLEETMDVGEKRRTVLPFGLFVLGRRLQEIGSVLGSSSYIKDVLPVLERLEIYANAEKFEKIGQDAKSWHELLVKQKGQSPFPDLAPISDKQRRSMQDMIAGWQVLAEERMKGLYLITPDTTVMPEKLIKGIEAFLGKEELGALETIELSDLTEACKCILTGADTAAEFIALRAAESQLRRWYERKAGQKLEKKPWGFVLDKLTEIYSEKERPKELKLLGYLKDRRDEIAHPERTSTTKEAETTLMNVLSLVSALSIATLLQ
jgi:hypothetical protein